LNFCDSRLFSLKKLEFLFVIEKRDKAGIPFVTGIETFDVIGLNFCDPNTCSADQFLLLHSSEACADQFLLFHSSAASEMASQLTTHGKHV